MNRPTRLRLLPGGLADDGTDRRRPEVLLETSGVRVLVAARGFAIAVGSEPGLLEALLSDPRVHAVLLALMDAVDEYEGHAAQAGG